MKAPEALQAMFDGSVLFERDRPEIYVTFDSEDGFIERFDNSDGKCAGIWMKAMTPRFTPNQEWTVLEPGSEDQPRTMCNKHGWWDYGPCKYCTRETMNHKDDCAIYDYVPRSCNCGSEASASGRQKNDE